MFSSIKPVAASRYCWCLSVWPAQLYRSTAPRAGLLILQFKPSTVFLNSLWKWLPDDRQGLELGFKLNWKAKIENSTLMDIDLTKYQIISSHADHLENQHVTRWCPDQSQSGPQVKNSFFSVVNNTESTGLRHLLLYTTFLVQQSNGNNQARSARTARYMHYRHGPEVPKFVFMAVGFETYCHASRMAQLITMTFSVELPPTYILLN